MLLGCSELDPTYCTVLYGSGEADLSGSTDIHPQNLILIPASAPIRRGASSHAGEGQVRPLHKRSIE